MSTKCSIAYGDNFHLYQDLLDERHVHLHLRQVEFEASGDELTVKIPLHLWEFLRSFPGADLSEAAKTDEEMEHEAIAKVDERLNKYSEAAADSAHPALQLGGALVMGPIDLPRDQQIENYIRYRRQLRERQREVLNSIQALRAASAP